MITIETGLGVASFLNLYMNPELLSISECNTVKIRRVNELWGQPLRNTLTLRAFYIPIQKL